MRALTIKTRRGKLDVGRMRVVWRRFARYTQPHRAALLGAMLAATGATAAQLAAPWPIKVVFDHVLMPQPDGSWLGSVVTRLAPTPVGVLLWSCGAILLIAALDGFFSYVRDVSLARTGQMVVAKVRKDLFGHLQRLPPAVFERRPTGDLLTRLTGDVQMLQQMLVGAMVTAGQGLVLVLAMTVAMFLLNPLLAALALTAVPLTLWASWRIARRIPKAVHQQRQRESAVASIAHDVLGAMAVVQAFNREPTEYERFAGQDRKSLRAGLKTTRLESRLYRTVSLASAIGLCAIIFFGARAVLDGAMTPGDLLVFLAYLRGLGRPMRHLAKVTGQLAKSTTCGERIAIVGPTGSGKSTLLKLILRTLLKLILRLYDAALGYARPGLRRISLRAPGRRRGGRGGEGAVRIEIRR